MKMMKRQNLKMKMSFAVIKDMAGGVFYNYLYLRLRPQESSRGMKGGGVGFDNPPIFYFSFKKKN